MKKNFIHILTVALIVTTAVKTGALKAQIYTDPTAIPDGRLTDCAPVFHALDAQLFSGEIFTRHQYMALEGYPSSYHLSLAGSPKSFFTASGRFVLHGEAYEKSHGFQHNVHTSLGAASLLRVWGWHFIYADLHYEFAYKWYNLRNVISENPAYAASVENSASHSPTFSLGYGYHGMNWKTGAMLTGNLRISDNRYTPHDWSGSGGQYFSVGGTAWWQHSFGRDWKEGLSLWQADTYINYTWCSMNETGHTVSAGFSGRYACLSFGAFYRHSSGLEYLGASAGIDIGQKFKVFYSAVFPFRPGGATAGIAAHEFGIRLTWKQDMEQNEKGDNI